MNVACIWFLKPNSTEKVAELCFRFSPQICVRQNEAVFIEIGKCKNLYTPEGFAKTLQTLLLEIDVAARLAFGFDITDSLVQAKYGVRDWLQLPLHALIELCDPFNKDAVLQKYLHKMIHTFKELGLSSLQEFNKVPAQELTSRFGSTGLLAKQRLNLEVPIVWPYWKLPEVIYEKVEFPYFEFYGELEPILFELKKQLDTIFQRLWARQLKAQKMCVKIYCETNSINTKKFRQFDFDFLFAQGSTKGALNIIKERLSADFQKNPVTTPLQGLECIVTEHVKGLEAQRNLLHNHDEIAEQKQALLGQLTEKLGADRIFHAALVEDRRPERSWRKVATPNSVNAEILKKIPLRPTHLIKPISVQITAGFIHIRSKTYKILKWSTWTERITGSWQDNTSNLENGFERNYYKVEIENGMSLSIFQTANQNYYLHGYYG